MVRESDICLDDEFSPQLVADLQPFLDLVAPTLQALAFHGYLIKSDPYLRTRFPHLTTLEFSEFQTRACDHIGPWSFGAKASASVLLVNLPAVLATLTGLKNLTVIDPCFPFTSRKLRQLVECVPQLERLRATALEDGSVSVVNPALPFGLVEALSLVAKQLTWLEIKIIEPPSAIEHAGCSACCMGSLIPLTKLKHLGISLEWLMCRAYSHVNTIYKHKPRDTLEKILPPTLEVLVLQLSRSDYLPRASVAWSYQNINISGNPGDPGGIPDLSQDGHFYTNGRYNSDHDRLNCRICIAMRRAFEDIFLFLLELTELTGLRKIILWDRPALCDINDIFKDFIQRSAKLSPTAIISFSSERELRTDRTLKFWL